LIDWLANEIGDLPADGLERCTWRRRIRGEIQQFGERRFGWPQGYRDLLVSEEFYDSTVHFARWARRFDPDISGPDVAQGLRNVWIVNSIQMLLGQEVSLTPAVFAYSMLYPYTDNYLDDPSIESHRKRSLNQKLGMWLAGEDAAPTDRHQKDVHRLVLMIEDQFDRQRYPSVFSSLQAIHAGQIASLSQHDSGSCLTESDLLMISIRKGGASVLADGYLAASGLDASEEDFCFGYGVFLQLLDDLQDVPEDSAAGHQTLFTLAATTGDLDGITSRLYHFMQSVVLGAERFGARRYDTPKDLILRNCVSLLVGAIAESPGLFTWAFRRRMVRRWPLGSRSMLRLRARAQKRFRVAGDAVRSQHGVRSIFELF